MRFLDQTQDFSLHTPTFAGYPGPATRWIKRLAFEKAGGQEITMTLRGIGDYDLYGPDHFERWEKDTGIKIDAKDILIVRTGYHRYYCARSVTHLSIDALPRVLVSSLAPPAEAAPWRAESGPPCSD